MSDWDSPSTFAAQAAWVRAGEWSFHLRSDLCREWVSPTARVA